MLCGRAGHAGPRLDRHRGAQVQSRL